MTHENPQSSYTEHRDGPEHDHSLPDATDIAEYSDVEDSLYQVFHYEDVAD